MENLDNTKEVVTPNWIRPNIEEERGEIERVVRDFLALEPNEENIKHFIDVLENAPIVELSDELWELIENTDSFHNIRPGHLEDVEIIVEEYNQGLPSGNKRNFSKHVNLFLEGIPIELPTVIKNKAGKMHLVSGNTRLMVARALGVRPKVIIGEF